MNKDDNSGKQKIAIKNHNSKRYTISDIHNSQFIKVHKFLLQDPFRSVLSNDSILLYGYLSDINELSIKNKWIDEKNNVYIKCTRDNMGNFLNAGKTRTLNAVRELTESGLMEEEREGLGKPNKIYLMKLNDNFIEKFLYNKEMQSIQEEKSRDSKSAVKTADNGSSRQPVMKLQEVSKSTPSNTNTNKTYINKTKSNQILEKNEKEDQIRREDLQLIKDNYIEILKANIQYDDLILKHQSTSLDYQSSEELKNRIIFYDFVIEEMSKIYCKTNGEKIFIDKSFRTVKEIKTRFKNIDNYIVDYVYTGFTDNSSNIKRPDKYLLTALFKAPLSMIAHNQSRAMVSTKHSEN